MLNHSAFGACVELRLADLRNTVRNVRLDLLHILDGNGNRGCKRKNIDDVEGSSNDRHAFLRGTRRAVRGALVKSGNFAGLDDSASQQVFENQKSDQLSIFNHRNFANLDREVLENF